MAYSAENRLLRMDTLNPSSLGADLNRRRTHYDTSLHTEADQSVTDFKQLLEKATAAATQARMNSGIQVATADNQIIDQTDLNHEQAERLYGQLIEIRAKLSKDWQQLQRAEQAIFNFRASLEYAHQELRPHNTKEGTRRAAQNRRFEDIRQANLEYMAQQHPEMMTLHRGLLLELARIQVAMEVVDQRLDALNKQLGSNVEPLRQPSRVERYAKVVTEVAAIAALLIMIYEYLPILTNDANKALAAEVDSNADDDSSSALYELEGACVGLEEASDDLGGIIDDLPDLGNFGFSLDPDFDAKVTKAYESACEEEGIEPGDLGKITINNAEQPEDPETESSNNYVTLPQLEVGSDLLAFIVENAGELQAGGATIPLGNETVLSIIKDITVRNELITRLSSQQQIVEAIRILTAPNTPGDAHIELVIQPDGAGGAKATTVIKVDAPFTVQLPQLNADGTNQIQQFLIGDLIADADGNVDTYLNHFISPITNQPLPNTIIEVVPVDEGLRNSFTALVVFSDGSKPTPPEVGQWIVVEHDKTTGQVIRVKLADASFDFPTIVIETQNNQQVNARLLPSLNGTAVGKGNRFFAVPVNRYTPEELTQLAGDKPFSTVGGVVTVEADGHTWQLVYYNNQPAWVSRKVSGSPQQVMPEGTPVAMPVPEAKFGVDRSQAPQNLSREAAIANFAEAMETMPSTYFTYDASGNVNRVSLTGAETLSSFGGDLFIMANGQEVLRWSETSGWLIPQGKTERAEIYLDYDFTGPKNESYSAMDQSFVFQIKLVTSAENELFNKGDAEWLEIERLGYPEWRNPGNSEYLFSQENPTSGAEIIDSSLETLFAMLVTKNADPDVAAVLNSGTSTVQTGFGEQPWDIGKRTKVILGRTPERGANWRGGVISTLPDKSFTVADDGSATIYMTILDASSWNTSSTFGNVLNIVATAEGIGGEISSERGTRIYQSINETNMPVVDGKIIIPMIIGTRPNETSTAPLTFNIF